MKFISVRDFRTSSSSIWEKLTTEREMIVTNNGKPIALLTPLNDETLEDTIFAVRRAKAINAVKKMQEISVKLGNDKMTLEEINAIITDVRKRIKYEGSN
ncbi:MAG: type II toxin-antitoxin system Phd/YefM family antitoxin [Spirochaetaceae bacterium]|jgi:antitoxin (DNA-binding transcriptional repressor) of toxin-antitoxin stability system|nr:type II toxin-antitoxin system Phd/YefM family antitoxin [Spirochaetaceae bacterium]